MRIGEVMTKDVVAFGPAATLKEVAGLLARERISGVPVIDAERHVLGVVSEADIVAREAGSEPPDGLFARLLTRRRAAAGAARTAGEAMSAPPLTIAPERNVAEAARLMTERRVNRLPVADRAGKLVGIVTRADLVRAFTRSDAEIEHELRDEVMLDTLWIDPATVEITVHEGEVTLAGELDTKAEARLLESFAARVPGVVSIRSRLRWRRDEPRLPRSQPYVPIPPRR